MATTPLDLADDLSKRLGNPALWRTVKPWEARMAIAVLPELSQARIANDTCLPPSRVRRLLDLWEWPEVGSEEDTQLRRIFERVEREWRDWEDLL